MSKEERFEYVNATNLTDDFRNLRSNTVSALQVSPDMDQCPVCLDVHEDPRTLACHHTYCRLCLQYTIDMASVCPDPHRGFVCVLCGYFTKVQNYSIPRTQWADQAAADYPLPERVKDLEEHETSTLNTKRIDTSNKWFLDWCLSAYPRSYLKKRGLNPFKRMNKLYIYVDDPASTNARPVPPDDTHSDTDTDDTGIVPEQADHRSNRKQKRFSSDDTITREKGCSEITAISFYNDSVIVYDQGLGELQMYNSAMTLEQIVEQEGVFDIAVFYSTVYMTVPDTRAVYVYNLETSTRHKTLYLTQPCYGIEPFAEELAMLLCDSTNINSQICFLRKTGVFGRTIKLKGGTLEFKEPRQLAVCDLTHLMYVSDAVAGIVKCYRLDGQLCWERAVFGAGTLAVYNGYVLVCRAYTSSIDILGGAGKFEGRLSSHEYDIVGPRCMAIRNKFPDFLLVDEEQLMHRYTIRKSGVPQKKNTACFCEIS